MRFFLGVFIFSLCVFAIDKEDPKLPEYNPNAPLFDEKLTLEPVDPLDKKMWPRKKSESAAAETYLPLQQLLAQPNPSEKEFKKLQLDVWKARKEFLKFEQAVGYCHTRDIESTKKGYSISDGSCLLPHIKPQEAFDRITKSLLKADNYPRNYHYRPAGFTHVLKFDLFNLENGKFVPVKEIKNENEFYAQIVVDTFWGNIPLIKNAAFTYFFKGKIQRTKTADRQDFYLTFKAVDTKTVTPPDSYFEPLKDLVPAVFKGEKLDRIELSELEGMWYVNLDSLGNIYIRYRTFANFDSIPDSYSKKEFLKLVVGTELGRNVSSGILLDTLVQIFERGVR